MSTSRASAAAHGATTGVGGQFEYTTRGLMLAPGAATTITIEDDESAHQRAVTVWPSGQMAPA